LPWSIQEALIRPIEYNYQINTLLASFLLRGIDWRFEMSWKYEETSCSPDSICLAAYNGQRVIPGCWFISASP